jgi:hypothetical protein
MYDNKTRNYAYSPKLYPLWWGKSKLTEFELRFEFFSILRNGPRTPKYLDVHSPPGAKGSVSMG